MRLVDVRVEADGDSIRMLGYVEGMPAHRMRSLGSVKA
jgi:hypothetical protein